MKLIWIVNVNFDSFLKFRQFVSYSDGIGSGYSVHQVHSIFLIFVVVCSTMLVVQKIHIVTKQVGSGLTCVQHFVQILARYRLS
jgi:hypothetical protein